MNFKNIDIILFFLFIFNLCFSQSKWNIILGNWQDLSGYKDKSIGVMLKKSIFSQLQREKDFNVIEVKENELFFNLVSEAHSYCISNKADVIVYGFYYVEGKTLFVITEVWDVLKKQLKMRTEARGVVTIDIFDTIDEIAINARGKIREILPLLTLEEEVEIKKLRQTIYEKEEIKIERLFYTRFGFNFETGHKILKSATEFDSQGIPTKWDMLEGNFPDFFSLFGFMLRIWDIRVDFLGGSMPGFPVYMIDKGKIEDTSKYTLINLYFSYYLPFWEKKFALGLGIYASSTISGFYIDRDRGITNYDSSMEGPPWSLILFWNPNKNFELSFTLNLLFYQYEEYETDNGRREYTEIIYNIPLVSISPIYFFSKELGIEGRFLYSNKHIKLSSKHDSICETMSFYLGLVYRVDFLEIEKEKKNE